MALFIRACSWAFCSSINPVWQILFQDSSIYYILIAGKLGEVYFVHWCCILHIACLIFAARWGECHRWWVWLCHHWVDWHWLLWGNKSWYCRCMKIVEHFHTSEVSLWKGVYIDSSVCNCGVMSLGMYFNIAVSCRVASSLRTC